MSAWGRTSPFYIDLGFAIVAGLCMGTQLHVGRN